MEALIYPSQFSKKALKRLNEFQQEHNIFPYLLNRTAPINRQQTLVHNITTKVNSITLPSIDTEKLNNVSNYIQILTSTQEILGKYPEININNIDNLNTYILLVCYFCFMHNFDISVIFKIIWNSQKIPINMRLGDINKFINDIDQIYKNYQDANWENYVLYIIDQGMTLEALDHYKEYKKP